MKKHSVSVAVLGFFLTTVLSLAPCYAKKPNLRRMKSDLEKAQAADTYEAYRTFLDKHGKYPDVEFVVKARGRIKELFYEKHIKTIQIVFLSVVGVTRHGRPRGPCVNLDCSLLDANRTARDGQKLFDSKLKSILEATLLKKGYSEKYTGSIRILIPEDYEDGPAHEPEKALAKARPERDVDAILFFLIGKLLYPLGYSGGYTHPYMDSYYSDRGDKLTEIPELSWVELWCDVFDLKSRTKVFSGHSRGFRKTEEQETGRQGGLYTGYTRFVRWRFIESEEDLIQKAMSETLSEFPEAQVTK
jgi:hypothetical protein